MVDLMMTNMMTTGKTINDSGCNWPSCSEGPIFGWSVVLNDEMPFLYSVTPRELDVFCYYVDHCQPYGHSRCIKMPYNFVVSKFMDIDVKCYTVAIMNFSFDIL